MASFLDDILSGLRNLGQYAGDLMNPTVRLGVTGLSRSGKTVFITALVHALMSGARLPLFAPQAEGRIRKVSLAPQPDDTVPRFPYEDHLAALTGPNRHWPQSTTRISELRIVVEYESKAGWTGGISTLTIDIVDYPGEWLLDLPLLDRSYAQWSAETLALASVGPRAPLAAAFLHLAQAVPADAAADEGEARTLAASFTAFLRSCRDEAVSLSSLPPGRFLMPGDLDGSPALTFAPLPAGEGASPLAAMMERRYDAYRSHIVRPFFRDHFARLDRQIVLIDALTALNAGPAAVADLESALADVLTAFRTGRNTVLGTVFAPRIDRVLFAATKADHLHHTNHDRLEAIVRLLAERAAGRAESGGASVDVAAIAAVRATREVNAKQGRSTMPCVAGVPLAGEQLGKERFDGEAEAALYPGELPDDPTSVLSADGAPLDLRFLRFRPPLPERLADGRLKPLPSIRMDRALDFLLGDRLR
jgi:uncharacterized protein